MDDLATHLRQLEEKLFDPTIRSSAQAIAGLLSPDFREIGSSGRFWDFDQTLEALPREKPDRGVTSGTDFQLKLLAEGVALLTYQSVHTRSDGSERKTLRSSIWRLEDDGNWRMVFHQGTLAA
ncbi:DUF4440 domain-containing protein [Rhizobium sp. BK376]|uniref:nuclear transport factor 2 family protein n=1 Tax=Rhizobium sp. BK376 TaxID=2512149 RepID=UPI0010508C7E|nr:DUF4440 domain-containing protein [Rhizobium sp. BK376]TCR91588.1 hypothetical protein EV561_10229 [Rhizobium sp. BK376]